MKVLIVGGTGFIGRHLQRQLSEDHELKIISRRKADKIPIKGQLHEAEHLLGDIADFDFINSSCKGIDCIINLASTVVPSTSNKNPIYDVQTNLIGALHTLQAAINNDISKYIFLSSGGTVYGTSTSSNAHREADPTDPICSYGIIKLTIEKYIDLFNKLHGLPYSIIRLSNPYGPEYSIEKPQGVIHHFISKAINNDTITVWGDGSIERDFLYIDDVVSAICKSMKHVQARSLLNIGSGKSTSIRTILEIISDISGAIPSVIYEPSRSCDVQKSVLSIEQAKLKLGWEPKVSLVDGIRMTYQSALETSNAQY